MDGLVVSTLMPRKVLYNSVFLAIDWYFKGWFIGKLVTHGNIVLIDINNNIKSSVEEITAQIKAGKNVLIFPEGAELGMENWENLRKCLR